MKNYNTNQNETNGNWNLTNKIALVSVVLATLFFIANGWGDTKMARTLDATKTTIEEAILIGLGIAENGEKQLDLLEELKKNLEEEAAPHGIKWSGMNEKPAASTESSTTGSADVNKYHSGQVDPIEKQKWERIWSGN